MGGGRSEETPSSDLGGSRVLAARVILHGQRDDGVL